MGWMIGPPQVIEFAGVLALMTMIAYAFLPKRRLKKVRRKKEATKFFDVAPRFLSGGIGANSLIWLSCNILKKYASRRTFFMFAIHGVRLRSRM
jgi:hypothetical protein